MPLTVLILNFEKLVWFNPIDQIDSVYRELMNGDDLGYSLNVLVMKMQLQRVCFHQSLYHTRDLS